MAITIILTQCGSLHVDFYLCVEWILRHHITAPVVSKLISVIYPISNRPFEHAFTNYAYIYLIDMNIELYYKFDIIV